MSTVNFGKRERFKFIAAGTLQVWTPPVTPAVYAVTYKQDPETRPKAHTVLFFGQAENLSEQAPTINKNVGSWWTERGGVTHDLFVFVHPMPGSTQMERYEVQSQLVAEYDPQGNN